MDCETLIRIDPDGTKHYKSKKAYNTLDEAIKAAKRMNSQEKNITKVVSYKCKKCFKYHIGRNGKKLSDKEKEKYFLDVIRNTHLKVVGKIDLKNIK